MCVESVTFFFFFLRKDNGVIRFNVVENLNHETLNFCFPLCEYETLSVRIHTLDILVPVDYLHGGGGPQVGEVTRLGGVTRLSI